MSDLDGRAFTKRIDRHGQSYMVPADHVSERWLNEEVKEGKTLLLSARSTRNPKHHSKFFVLLTLVLENAPERFSNWKTVENVLDAVKIATGHTYPLLATNGDIVYIPKSIAFASMSQEEFEKFYDLSVDILANEVLQTAPDYLRNEVELFLSSKGKKDK